MGGAGGRQGVSGSGAGLGFAVACVKLPTDERRRCAGASRLCSNASATESVCPSWLHPAPAAPPTHASSGIMGATVPLPACASASGRRTGLPFQFTGQLTCHNTGTWRLRQPSATHLGSAADGRHGSLALSSCNDNLQLLDFPKSRICIPECSDSRAIISCAHQCQGDRPLNGRPVRREVCSCGAILEQHGSCFKAV